MKFLFFILAMLILVVLPTTLGRVTADDTLVLYLPFTEGEGKATSDHSNYGNHGVLIGEVQWVEGKYGKAIQPMLESGYVEVASSDSLKIKNQITLMAWIYIEKWKGGDQWISKGDPYNIGVYDGKIRFSLGGGGAQPILTLDGDKNQPQLGEWQHVAATYDPDPLEMRIYYNGNLAGKKLVGFDHSSDDTPLCIGGKQQNTFDGKIDEVAIYNRALTEEEIRKAMKGNITGDLGKEIAVYPLNGATTTWGRIKAN
jgi:hypothetical protein